MDDSGGQRPYQAVEMLAWSRAEAVTGKPIKLNQLSYTIKLKLFRVTMSAARTESIVTRDLTQSDREATQEESGQRWKVEPFHREEQQLTGIGDCEWRLNRASRNHLSASMLVWVCLKQLAYQTKQTVYQLKHGLLSDYLRQQLRTPAITYC